MKIIAPNIELWEQTDDKISHVARCARVCYGKEKGNDDILYENLKKRKHWSMFRHETWYAAVPVSYHDGIVFNAIRQYYSSPYIKYFTYKDVVYIITNGNFMLDIEQSNPVLCSIIKKHSISAEEAMQIEYIWKHFARYTFCIITQISTSRELNRVSPNNIAEQSTRYVYEQGTICQPHWMTDEEAYIANNNAAELLSSDNDKLVEYVLACDRSFTRYKNLVDKYSMMRQDARGVLPLDTATKCVYTYTVDEWFEIIQKRVYNTTGKAHPNAAIICKLIEQNLNELGYEIKI